MLFSILCYCSYYTSPFEFGLLKLKVTTKIKVSLLCFLVCLLSDVLHSHFQTLSRPLIWRFSHTTSVSSKTNYSTSVKALLFLFLRFLRCFSLLLRILSSLFSRFLCCYIRLFRLRTGSLIAFCFLANRPFTRLPSVTRRRISTASCPCHCSFATCHRARGVRAPGRETSVNGRTNVRVTLLLFSRLTFARFSTKNRRRIIALSCSKLLSSAARFVAGRECAPVAKFPVYRADFQEARLLVLVSAESVAVLTVSSRRWVLAQAISGLNAFTAVFCAIIPNRPFGISAVDCNLEKHIITCDKNTAQRQG